MNSDSDGSHKEAIMDNSIISHIEISDQTLNELDLDKILDENQSDSEEETENSFKAMRLINEQDDKSSKDLKLFQMQDSKFQFKNLNAFPCNS